MLVIKSHQIHVLESAQREHEIPVLCDYLRERFPNEAAAMPDLENLVRGAVDEAVRDGLVSKADVYTYAATSLITNPEFQNSQEFRRFLEEDQMDQDAVMLEFTLRMKAPFWHRYRRRDAFSAA